MSAVEDTRPAEAAPRPEPTPYDWPRFDWHALAVTVVLALALAVPTLFVATAVYFRTHPA